MNTRVVIATVFFLFQICLFNKWERLTNLRCRWGNLCGADLWRKLLQGKCPCTGWPTAETHPAQSGLPCTHCKLDRPTPTHVPDNFLQWYIWHLLKYRIWRIMVFKYTWIIWRTRNSNKMWHEFQFFPKVDSCIFKYWREIKHHP